jgi:hypothetical protein
MHAWVVANQTAGRSKVEILAPPDRAEVASPYRTVWLVPSWRAATASQADV